MQPDKCFTNTRLFGQGTTWGAWNMQMKLSFFVWLGFSFSFFFNGGSWTEWLLCLATSLASQAVEEFAGDDTCTPHDICDESAFVGLLY